MSGEPKPYVLIVDDEAGFRELLRRILEPAGYPLQEATNAHDALRQVAVSPPAVVICDIHMPGPTGLWLAHQIAEQLPHTALVLATSDASIPATESLRTGIVAYLVKPFRAADVHAAVREGYRWWSAESGGDVPSLKAVTPSSDAAGRVSGTGAPSAPAHTTTPGRNRRWTPATLAAAAGVAILAAVATNYCVRTRPSGILSHVAASSGMVLVYDGDGNTLTQASGFFIEPETFVTNRHVVSNGLQARIVTGSTQYAVAGVTAVDRERDLALLRTTASSPNHLSIAARRPAIGDAISVYGAPLGLSGTLTTGIVSTNGADDALLQITAPVSAGSSGSPVVDAQGAVVGIVTSSNQLGQSLNFAVPAIHLKRLLDERHEPRPLLLAARGAADDRERHDLVGPVRSVTVTYGESLAALIERLVANYADSMPLAAAQQRARQEALASSRTQLRFGRDGQLLEYQAGDGSIRNEMPEPPTGDETAAVTYEERDTLGNPLRRQYDDGSEVVFSYQFDARGNWIAREASGRDSTSGRPVLSVERRAIEYWD